MRSVRVFSVVAFGFVLSSCGSKNQSPSAASEPTSLTATPSAKLPVADGITATLKRIEAAPSGNIDSIGAVTSPLASAEAMSKIVVSRQTPIKISGWGVDLTNKKLASGIEIVIDGNSFKAIYGSPRPDVAKWLKTPGYEKSGYTYELPANSLTAGVHTMELRIISADSKGFYALGPFNFRAE